MRKIPKVVPISQAKRTRLSRIPQNEEDLQTLTCRQTLNQISFQLDAFLPSGGGPKRGATRRGKLLTFPHDNADSNADELD
jgi:hypothetical protein